MAAAVQTEGAVSNNSINFAGRGIAPRQQSWTLQGFSSYEQYVAYAEKLKEMFAATTLGGFLTDEKRIIDTALRNNTNTRLYGLNGKQPKSYEEAMARDTFVYWEEYMAVKNRIQKDVLEKLAKSSTAEAMKDKLVYNDMELGDFVFERASMGLIPNVFYYSPKHRRELVGDELNPSSESYALIVEEVDGKSKYYYKPDGSIILLCIKSEKEDGTFEYIEAAGNASMAEAMGAGMMSVRSNVKKSYLYRQKQPRLNNAIRLIVGLTRGGYTAWENDFYGGVATGIIIETLESLGYAVSVDLAFGGGRCTGCRRPMNTANRLSGRRFFTLSAKTFNDPLNLEELLYMICDPSFHSVKLLSYINCFFQLYGDMKDNSMSRWHGIEKEDIFSPVGAAMMARDLRMKNTNTLYYLVHRVGNEAEAKQVILDIVLNAENINLKLKEKALTYG